MNVVLSFLKMMVTEISEFDYEQTKNCCFFAQDFGLNIIKLICNSQPDRSITSLLSTFAAAGKVLH